MWISNARVILPDQIVECGSVQVEGQQVVQLVDGPAPQTDIDATGLTLLPGLIDLHGDMLEREIQPRPGSIFPFDLSLLELDKRLVGTGITTAYAAISFVWSGDNMLRREEHAREIIRTVNSLRPTLLANHLVHVRFEITSPEAAPLLTELLAADQVQMVSLMDHTPGQGQYRNIEKYIQFIIAWRKQVSGTETTPEALRAEVETAQQRPKAWDIVREIIQIAAAHKLPIASHDDDSPEKVAFMTDLGVTLSEFPVTLSAADAAKQRGMHVAMGAPNAFRGTSHSSNLSAREAIAAGVVDVLATDYYPASMLHAVYAIVEAGILDLPAAVRLVTANPADALGLHNCGTIAPGQQADLVLVDDTARPRVRGTIRAGVPVYWDGQMAARTLHPWETPILA